MFTRGRTVLAVLLVAVPVLAAVVVSAAVRRGCGSRALTGPDRVSALYCVSNATVAGQQVLLLRNRPGTSGSRIGDEEAQRAVDAALPYLPVAAASVCFQRSDLDAAPVCFARTAGAVAARSLRTVDDGASLAPVLVPSAAVFGAAFAALVLAMSRRRELVGSGRGKHR